MIIELVYQMITICESWSNFEIVIKVLKLNASMKLFLKLYMGVATCINTFYYDT